MKALTIYQPWASFVACGIKRYETRSWATTYRGPIAIHAGKTRAYYCTRDYLDIVIAASQNPLFESYVMGCAETPEHELPFGAVIATAELIGCWEIGKHPLSGTPVLNVNGQCRSISDEEWLFGNYTPGRFAWELDKVNLLEKAIPARGMQGLWEWEAA